MAHAVLVIALIMMIVSQQQVLQTLAISSCLQLFHVTLHHFISLSSLKDEGHDKKKYFTIEHFK